MSAIRLADSCSLVDLFEQVSGNAAHMVTDGHLEIATLPDSFIPESSLAFLTAWGLLQQIKGIKLTAVGDTGVIRYLARMDVLRTLGIPYTEAFERHTETGRFIPVQLIVDASSCKRAVDKVCDLVMHQCEDARQFLPALEWAANEIADNILLHSETPCPGVLVAQFFPKLNRLDVAVCDMGRGLKASLRQRFDLCSHEEAISKAIERGVTRDPDIGMGNGLTGTVEIIRVNRGDLCIWTGNATLMITNGSDRNFSTHAEVLGTGIALSIYTNRPIDLRETFIGAPAYTYIESVADRLTEGNPLRIIEECASTGNRAPAKYLRRKIKTLLPDLTGTAQIQLDFSGISSAASSFLDELFGRLAADVGPNVVRSKIRIINASEQIMNMANVVIEQRLQIEGGESRA